MNRHIWHNESFFERSHNGPEKYILLSRRYMSRFLIYIFSKYFHIFNSQWDFPLRVFHNYGGSTLLNTCVLFTPCAYSCSTFRLFTIIFIFKKCCFTSKPTWEKKRLFLLYIPSRNKKNGPWRSVWKNISCDLLESN